MIQSVNSRYPIPDGGGRAPPELTLSPARNNRTPLHLTWPGWRKSGDNVTASDVADNSDQIENTGLGASSDVPDARAAAISGSKEGSDHITNVDEVTGLQSIAIYNRDFTSKDTAAERGDNPGFTRRILTWPIDVGEPQHRMRGAVQSVIKADILLRAKLRSAIWRLWQLRRILRRGY